jgi:alpha-galactosidase
MAAGLPVQFPPRDDAAWAGKAKALIEQYLVVQKFYYGDYYPLTPYSQARDAWMAYQLDLPESGEGLLVVLKRPESRQTRAALRLRAIESGVNYSVTDLDTGRVQTLRGERLLGEGLDVELTKRPDSALLRYRRLR